MLNNNNNNNNRKFYQEGTGCAVVHVQLRVPSLQRRYYGVNSVREEHRLSVLSRIFGPKRDGVTGEWRKLHNEELNDLYCSPNIVRVIKSRRLRWAGHVARMEEGRGVHKVLVGKLRERDHWGDQDVDWRVILRWILRMWEEVVGTG